MTIEPEVELSRLRQIGWDEWDPIGIGGIEGGGWIATNDDEYDSYLVHVAYLLRSGGSATEAMAYLNWAVSDHIGMRLTEEHRAAAERTVNAISVYLTNLCAGS